MSKLEQLQADVQRVVRLMIEIDWDALAIIKLLQAALDRSKEGGAHE